MNEKLIQAPLKDRMIVYIGVAMVLLFSWLYILGMGWHMNTLPFIDNSTSMNMDMSQDSMPMDKGSMGMEKDKGMTIRPSKNNSPQLFSSMDIGSASGKEITADNAAPRAVAGIIFSFLYLRIIMKVTARLKAVIRENISPITFAA